MKRIKASAVFYTIIFSQKPGNGYMQKIQGIDFGDKNPQMKSLEIQ